MRSFFCFVQSNYLWFIELIKQCMYEPLLNLFQSFVCASTNSEWIEGKVVCIVHNTDNKENYSIISAVVAMQYFTLTWSIQGFPGKEVKSYLKQAVLLVLCFPNLYYQFIRAEFFSVHPKIYKQFVVKNMITILCQLTRKCLCYSSVRMAGHSDSAQHCLLHVDSSVCHLRLEDAVGGVPHAAWRSSGGNGRSSRRLAQARRWGLHSLSMYWISVQRSKIYCGK